MGRKALLFDDGNDPEISDNEWDAMLIEDWLEAMDDDPLLPMSARETEIEWAHENADAWPLVDLPAGVSVEDAIALMVAAIPGGSARSEDDDAEQAARDADHPWATERYNPYHQKNGKFGHRPAVGVAGSAMPPAKPIRRSALSNPDTPRTRKVTNAEFQNLAGKGRATLVRMRERAKPATAVTDGARFRKIKDQAWNETREVWGGATVNPRNGSFLKGDEDLYALTIKPPGVESVRIPSSATRAEFDAAMDVAADRFGEQLTYEGSHLGVFHDGDLGSIDIDPVTITSSHSDVEEIGAYTNAVGGAYHFKSGDGYWPPYVED